MTVAEKPIRTFFSSNEFNLLLLILLFFAVILYQQLGTTLGLFILLTPVVLLMLNFSVTLLFKKSFSRKPVLLIFHLSLFFLVGLAILGRLTYLKATLELSAGEQFTGQLENIDSGIWHNYKLNSARFSNLGFTIHYHEGVMRDNTLNRIGVTNDVGQYKITEIGDHVPLVIGHYRFYTSHNKGFSPTFSWFPADGSAPQRGNINLPAYPIHEYKQAKEWVLPNSKQKIWTMLVIEENVLPETRAFDFRIPNKHHLVIRVDEQRYLLRPGEKITLATGVLRYDSLSSWMGYNVDYDWTRPWLLATCLTALFSLSLFYITRLRHDIPTEI